MPLAGTGMLLTSMDIDPADEADFNRWYDREHIEERVAIDGFRRRGAILRIQARRNTFRCIRPRHSMCWTARPIGSP
jgi:hypothetical protein